MTRTPHRLLRLLRPFALCICLANLQWAAAANIDGLINQARQHLEAGRFGEGLASATQATLADPNNYRGFYYTAMAQLALNDLPRAQSAATRSLDIAPESAKAGVRKVMDAISLRRNANKAPEDVVIFLSCTGETNIRYRHISIASTEKVIFKEIYRINLTANNFSRWKEGEWIEWDCTDDRYIPKGYIDYSDERSCSVSSDEFKWIALKKQTKDNGDKLDSSRFWKISRMTGILDFRNYYWTEEQGEKGGTTSETSAKCLPTDKPTPPPTVPVKF